MRRVWYRLRQQRTGDQTRRSGAPAGGWSLRYGVLLPGLILLMGAVLVMGPVAYRLVSDHLMGMAQSRAGEVLDALLARLDDHRQDRSRVVRILANDPDLNAALQTGDNERLRLLLVDQRASFGLDDVMVINTKGELLVSLNQKSPVIAAAAFLPLVQRIFDEGPVSEVRVLPYGLAVSAGTTFGSGDRRAALILSQVLVDLDLAEIKAREQVEVAAFQGNSVAAASLPVRERDTLAVAALHPSSDGLQPRGLLGVPWHLLPEHKPADQMEVDGTGYTASWATVPGGRILVLVENADLMMARDMFGRTILLATGLALAVLFLFSLLVGAVVVRPLQRIIQVTSAMTAGDFGQKAPTTPVRELNQLARAVNFMAERIQARISVAEQAASTDFLTGLHNHRYFQEALGSALQATAAGGAPCALMMIDLDHFKLYNDSLGHQAGDNLLRLVALEIRQHTRPSDIPCRYGGDEFAVILPDTDALTAAEIGHKIRQGVSTQRFATIDGLKGGRVTASIGIAIAPDHARTKEQMIKYADDSMYKSKHQSRQGVASALLDSLLPLPHTRAGESLRAAVQGWMTTVRAKDRYTYAHCERLVHSAAHLARAFGLSAQETQDLRLAAFLHDIGKIEIDAALLTKPEPLTPAEWEIVRLHPLWGAELLRPFPELAPVIPGILYHHERWDGSGYPHGLKGEHIPLIARMLALLDSFDSMISDRPYKQLVTPEAAFAELLRCAGSQFDPTLAEGFLRAFRPLAQQGLLVAPAELHAVGPGTPAN